MLTPDKYARYRELSRPIAEKVVKLGLIFRDIIERECSSSGSSGSSGAGGNNEVPGHTSVAALAATTTTAAAAGGGVEVTVAEEVRKSLEVTDAEVSEQWEAIVAQAKQKGETVPDKATAR